MLTKKEKYAQGGSVQVRLLQINYEVNKKSRLEMKCDFFKISTWLEKTTLTDTVNLVPRALFRGFGLEPTSKAREKRRGDEVLIQL